MNDSDYLESILAPLRASFHAKRRARAGVVDQISNTLQAYLRAVDVAVARELCHAHGLKGPEPSTPPAELAKELQRLVNSLPELVAEERGSASNGRGVANQRTATPIATDANDSTKRAKRIGSTSDASTGAASPSAMSTSVGSVEGSTCWPKLSTYLGELPLVVVGGPPHLERLNKLSPPATRSIEWIDTTRQGTHAIGNLERRIRDRRIGALLLLEGLVQHRHTDPLVSAARAVGLAHAFGGKGGRAALNHALQQLEDRVSNRG